MAKITTASTPCPVTREIIVAPTSISMRMLLNCLKRIIRGEIFPTAANLLNPYCFSLLSASSCDNPDVVVSSLSKASATPLACHFSSALTETPPKTVSRESASIYRRILNKLRLVLGLNPAPDFSSVEYFSQNQQACQRGYYNESPFQRVVHRNHLKQPKVWKKN